MHRQKISAVIGFSCVVVTSWLSGACDQPEKRRSAMPLTRSVRQYERDIPIPEGFRLVEEACEDQSTGTRRLYLRHIYEGSASNRYAVRVFYREQMPRARWHLVSDGNVKGEYTLRFEKGSEACTIRITDAEGSIGANTRVQVIIAQEERGEAPPKVRNGS